MSNHVLENSHGPLKRTPQARYFVDSEYFKTEMQQWFADRWVFVGRAEELPNPGDYILRTIAGESILITRGNDCKVRSFFNICTHRGTVLVESENTPTRSCQFSCPYHSWTFDCQGHLIGAPGMKDVDGFCEQNWGLRPIDCEIWAGFIFLNLKQNPPPLSEFLADLPEKFSNWPIEEMRIGERVEYHVQANWKLIIQNYSECLHCPSVHPALARLSPPTSGENEPANLCYAGGRMSLNEGIASMTTSGSTNRPLISSLSESQKRHVYYYAWLPNLLLSLHPDYVMTHRIEPLTNNQTRIVCEWLFEKSTMASTGFQSEDAVAFWDMTNKQDWHVSELTQRGLSSRAYRPGPYSNREELLYDLDQILLPKED